MKRTVGVLIVLASVVMAADVVTEPFVGVTHIHRTLSSPRPLNINIVKIDLGAEGISFKSTPSNGDAAGESNASKMTDFVNAQGAQIGINCGFFFWDSNAGGYDVMGYAASEGEVYSKFTAWSDWPTPYVSLNISSTNKADIIYPLPSFPIGGYVAPFGVQVYNAVAGSEWIVKDGVNNVSNWDINTALHPRSAGGITADNHLILLTVDGRQEGFSEGMYVSEVADLLISLGAVQGINFDGGGSTAMAFADPLPRLVNVPINGGVAYSQRSTPNNLAVYAISNTTVPDRTVFVDFEDGNESTFAYSPGYSGSTLGIDTSQSTAEPTTDDSWTGQWCERLFIKDDPATTAVAEYSEGGWFVRWVSGATASPSQNIAKPTTGYVGFWAKTSSENLKISIVLDNDSQMERGLPIDMPADGYWHCYQWPLEDDNSWEGWINGDGLITGSSFTLDSIQIFGPDNDCEIFVDTICHDVQNTIDDIDDCSGILKAGMGLAADLSGDCIVNGDDLDIIAQNWLQENSDADIIVSSGNIVDLLDVSAIAEAWLDSNDPAGN
ncbi:MAG: phosphodiester glycosidase family protein [Sedimentisphaeraceae bacterium JB056]